MIIFVFLLLFVCVVMMLLMRTSLGSVYFPMCNLKDLQMKIINRYRDILSSSNNWCSSRKGNIRMYKLVYERGERILRFIMNIEEVYCTLESTSVEGRHMENVLLSMIETGATEMETMKLIFSAYS